MKEARKVSFLILKRNLSSLYTCVCKESNKLIKIPQIIKECIYIIYFYKHLLKEIFIDQKKRKKN